LSNIVLNRLAPAIAAWAAYEHCCSMFDVNQVDAQHQTAEILVELTGIEPVTPWLQTRCSPS
jgi:hypothetical protein